MPVKVTIEENEDTLEVRATVSGASRSRMSWALRDVAAVLVNVGQSVAVAAAAQVAEPKKNGGKSAAPPAGK